MRPASQSLRDYGQYQRMIMIMLFAGSGGQWAVARLTDGPILDEINYGPFIMAYSAETWVIPIFIGSGLHLIAQVINGDRRLPPIITPIVRAVSALVCAADLLLFAYGARYAEHSDPYFIYSGLVGLAVLWFAFLGVRDALRGWRVMVAQRGGS